MWGMIGSRQISTQQPRPVLVAEVGGAGKALFAGSAETLLGRVESRRHIDLKAEEVRWAGMGDLGV